MIYKDTLANYRAGQDEFGAGDHGRAAHRSESLDGPGLQDFIKQSADPAKPVAVNVIDFGADSDRATWEAVAKLSAAAATRTSPRRRRRSWPPR